MDSIRTKYTDYIVQIFSEKQNQLLFTGLKNNAAKIQFLFDLFKDFGLDSSPTDTKDVAVAKSLKIQGNQLCQQQNYIQAIDIYNEAITKCPQHDLQGKKLYADLIADRSAAFFHDGQYEKVLKDEAFLKDYGNQSTPKKNKQRGKQARDALCQRKDSAVEFEVNGTVTPLPREELTWKSSNITYPALSNKLVVRVNGTIGRHVVALDDFKTGEIVAVENPMVLAVTGDSNCDHCAVSTNQIYACDKCTQGIYCSLECLEKGKVYHQYECLILTEKKGIEFLRTVLRMISQYPVEYIVKERKIQDIKYEDIMKPINILTCQTDVIIMMKLLMRGNYFGDTNQTEKHCLSESEVMVAELLFEYFVNLRCITNSLYELNTSKSAQIVSESIGIGIYPEISLFTHSCDPSVIGYYIDSRLVIRCIKPIRKGEIVYKTHNNTFHFQASKKFRLENLVKNFRSPCTCKACEEDWPLLKDCHGNVLRNPYKENEWKKYNSVGFLTMQYVDNLIALSGFAEYQTIRSILEPIVDNLFKLLKPPSRVISVVQDRLFICYQHMGNKHVNYKLD